MLSSIRHCLVGVIAALALVTHTLFLGIFLYLFILARLLLRWQAAQRRIQPAIVEIARLWIGGILWWMARFQRIEWKIDCPVTLNPRGWYLITANHQSWADIFVLLQVFHRKIPFLKFFIKKEMAKIPVVGQAWWALDFPFMQRHTKETLKQFPEKAGQDLEATKIACEKFSLEPTSVMNFLEGTRFSREKHARQNSPFRHLLKPKTGGIAFTIQALGDRFSALTNVTILYPGGVPTFWSMMCGQMREVIVKVEEMPIPAHFISGDYEHDKQFRKEIQQWVRDIWQRKDDLIEQHLHARQAGEHENSKAQLDSERMT